MHPGPLLNVIIYLRILWKGERMQTLRLGLDVVHRAGCAAPEDHRTSVRLSFLIHTTETPDLQAVALHELVKLL